MRACARFGKETDMKKKTTRLLALIMAILMLAGTVFTVLGILLSN